ncbi:hypothetical protein BOX15_Mlig002659g1, partial [Macrostomum lignano]
VLFKLIKKLLKLIKKLKAEAKAQSSSKAAMSSHREEQVARLKHELEDLSRQCYFQRLKTSTTISEIIQYINSHVQEDPLLNPVKDNPFNPKKSCELL